VAWPSSGLFLTALSVIMATIFCKFCKVGYASLGELPPVCPECNAPAHWITEPAETWPFRLSRNDKQFLRSIRVEP
jgi:hypothetical protein